MQEEVQFQKMTTAPIKKLILGLSFPCVISMLVSSIYNFADTFFVSKLGTSASGAVGVVFSLMAIIQAIGFTLGMGGGSVISAKLGEKKNQEAHVVASTAFFTALILGLLITIFGLIFLNPLMKMLGSTETSLPYARDYARYILLGAPIMAGSFVLNNQLRSEGKAKFSMIGLAFGGLLNIGLDPLFIFVFKMGISGAAIATLISQAVSFLILLSFFIFKKSLLELRIKNISRSFRVYSEIIRVGMPSLFRQGLASIATILLNKQAGAIGGDAALSAMSIVTKVFMVIFSLALGIGQGFQPVIGYNYSAQKYDRVKEGINFTYILMTAILLILGIGFFFSAEWIVWICNSDPDVVKIGKAALQYQCIAMPFLSVNIMCNMMYQSTRKKFRATLLSVCRQGLFFIPLVYLLPHLFAITGVELIQPVADLLTCLFSIPFFFTFLRHLHKLKGDIRKDESELTYENN